MSEHKKGPGRPATGRSQGMKDRAHNVAIQYLHCIMQGIGHEEAIEKLSCREWNGARLSESTIAADLKKSRSVAVSLDEYENSKNLKQRHPEWKGWRSEFDAQCDEDKKSFKSRLKAIHAEQVAEGGEQDD